MKNKQTSMVKRMLAWILAAAVALSIVTMPVQEAYAAGGTVKSVTVTNLPAKQLTLKKGKSFTLKSKVTVTGKLSKKVTYKTSNKKIATVNAKGKITAKKNGTAKITICSKANKKKKCTITVTVGTPVTKVDLNKSKSTLTVGQKLTLKASVTPKKASNKAVVWKTSDKKIAVVTSKGVVTAKKAGTVKITALAKDGSGKKKVCTITVKAKNQDQTNQEPEKEKPQEEESETTPAITELKVINARSIQVAVSPAQSLSAADFAVYTKKYALGAYRQQCAVDSVLSTDGVNYILTLQDVSSLYENRYIKVVIAKYGIEKEIFYTKDAIQYTAEEMLTVAVGTNIDETSSMYSFTIEGRGFVTASVSGLPAGIKYQLKYTEDESNIQFYGCPVQAGIYASTLTAEDEMGNQITGTVTWLVYSDSVLAASATPAYLLCDGSQGTALSQSVVAAGGSGEYTYALSGTTYNCTIDTTGEITGTFSTPGTYTLNVVVTDKKNTALKTSTQVVVYVKQGVKVVGRTTDMDGNPVPKAYVTFTNQNPASRYFVYEQVKSDYNGRYSIVLDPGTYDITSNYKTAYRYLYAQTITTAQTSYDIKLPVYKVDILSDNAKIDPELFGDWYDEAGNRYEAGNSLYLKNGSYTLTASQGFQSPYVYEAVLNVTVAGKAVTATAETTLKTEEIDIKTGTNQKLTLASKDDAKLLRFTADETGSYTIKVPAISGFNGKGMITVFRGDGSFMVAHGFDSESGTSISFYVVKDATYSFKILTDSDAPVTFTYDLTKK